MYLLFGMQILLLENSIKILIRIMIFEVKSFKISDNELNIPK